MNFNFFYGVTKLKDFGDSQANSLAASGIDLKVLTTPRFQVHKCWSSSSHFTKVTK